jgi:hypothetical protein
VRFLVRAQNEEKGWRFTAQSGDNDTWVTTVALLALRSAEDAGLDIPARCYRGALSWLDEVAYQDEKYRWKTGFIRAGDAEVRWENGNDTTVPNNLPTAIGVAGRLLAGSSSDNAKVSDSLEIILEDDFSSVGQDFTYLLFSTMAFWLAGRPEDKQVQAWFKQMRGRLLATQGGPGKCKAGSWEPDDHWSSKGGRVYAYPD